MAETLDVFDSNLQCAKEIKNLFLILPIHSMFVEPFDDESVFLFLMIMFEKKRKYNKN